MLIDQLLDYFDVLLDLIYPRNVKCIVCGEELVGSDIFDICKVCYSKIEFVYGYEDSLDFLSFERIYAVAIYKDVVKKMIYNLKYYDKVYIAKTIAELMKEKLIEYNVEFDVIVAVPLHFTKEKRRGYNQTHLICKHLKRLLNKKYKARVIERIKNTEDMNKLSRIQRFENIEGAFIVKNNEAIKNKRVILVDDVLTTGATANACSKVLIDAGAQSVNLLTFARGYY
ncbi:ComF family protein [Serpentinicella alkaliphila]|uniref:Competence protein ComFC n=1 Tax=Serpentinicella alkaliphila TaxID=1734049 RepID=A0A4R2U4W4_9FIRM|nr:ComF family protein [Serpentinicella alkaliphila]QUH24931.1 ComF family protein [Serpentinicella alkaliphila]TCQ02733.1 competence protein ComFC [Serpentinicella alkaliphila]